MSREVPGGARENRGAFSRNAPVVLFDGICNLCDASVNFIIDRDPGGTFRFAPLQSEAGRALLRQAGLPEHSLDALVLIEDGKVSARSAAALRIARRLSGLWPLLYALVVIPTFVRDGVYGFVARRRYRWFGRRDACRVPTPELQARFLEWPRV